MHGSIVYAQLTSAKPEVQADYETVEEVTRTPILNPEILNSHPNSNYHPGRLSFDYSPLVYFVSTVLKNGDLITSKHTTHDQERQSRNNRLQSCYITSGYILCRTYDIRSGFLFLEYTVRNRDSCL